MNSDKVSGSRKMFLAGFASALVLAAVSAGGALYALETSSKPASDAPAPIFFAPTLNYAPQKVVYHVATKGSWRDREAEAWRLVSVLNNHINAVKADKLTLQVVFQGDGVDALRRARDNPKLASGFDALKDKGVQFHVCANTLSARKIALETLHAVKEEDLVPAGVAEFVRLQQEGYSYIKF